MSTIIENLKKNFFKNEKKISCGVLHHLPPGCQSREDDSKSSKPLSQLWNVSASRSRVLKASLLLRNTRVRSDALELLTT